MAIIQFFLSFFKKKVFVSRLINIDNIKNLSFSSIYFLIAIVVVGSAFFYATTSHLTKENLKNESNLKVVTKSSEFTKFTDFLVSKINSPYKEAKYTIKNNDTIEKILRQFDIRNSDIKIISDKLKRKNLSSIYSGRELSIIFKKLEDDSNVLLVYSSINNTTSIEVRKSKNDFLIKENILKLYKKEVVVKNTINNNLYSSAIKSGIEPNIIVEFARIFGFEVDFQRDIRKGDWFEIFYEKLKMTTIK